MFIGIDLGKLRVGLQDSYTEKKAVDGVGGQPPHTLFTSSRYYPF